ncbi:hypothetical protein BTGOE5_55660 [Bacillus thuringiensis]|nr:hypothetical protein [Bacillus toyonensis]OFC92584.1 hypothetical protein BTGOE5_55660 [Bacillus thuringiensis]
MFSVIDFKKEEFELIQKNIEKSRGYVSYVDVQKGTRKNNPRYEKYLAIKQNLYSHYAPRRPIEQKSGFKHMYISLDSKDSDKEKLEKIKDKYGILNDYIIEYEILNGEIEGEYIAKHIYKPLEYVAHEKLISMDDNLMRLDKANLRDEFIMNNYKRFLLLPFLIKDGDNYTEAYVIANIYKEGVITLQVTLSFEHDKVIAVSDNPPRQQIIPEVHFYKSKQSYNTHDYWEKDIQKNITIDHIMRHCIRQLWELCKIEFKENDYERKITWIFGDYEMNKRANHKDFIEKNKKLYVSHLENGGKQFIDMMHSDDIDKVLQESKVFNLKELVYMCNSTFSIISNGSRVYRTYIEKYLKQEENHLKKMKVYDDRILKIYKDLTLKQMFDFIRFYELSFIKKHFVSKLLSGMSEKSIKTTRDFNLLRRDFNFLKLDYNEEILFKDEGTPKALYSDILEKTNTSALLTKAEELFKNIREDVLNHKEMEVKSNETIILIISSIIAVVLGYNGIKLIVNDILMNLPFIGAFVSLHPLRYTLGIWGLLVFIMIYLNIKRWFKNQQ